MFGKLTHLAVIHCYGKDSKTFLQGQLTCNLTLLKNTHEKNSKLAAHCSPKGRIISLARIIQESDESYYFILPESMLNICLTNLNKYAVFSKVTLEDITKKILLIGYDSRDKYTDYLNFFSNNIVTSTKINSDMQLCLYKLNSLDSDTLSSLQDINQAWEFAHIKNGIPAIYPETSELFIPQRLNLQELGGLSFKKGCYIGQEVLSRLYFRGEVKYKMVLGEIAQPLSTNLTIHPGEKILDHKNRTIGHIVSSIFHNNKIYILFEKGVLADKNFLFVCNTKINLLTLPYEETPYE